ncbi:glycosyltransferase 87 family protein [Streptomyces sp. NBC_00555]|uniref:glycosyltransferase 87 family protein n=1 Tax=Streptomyces sp. NBC_00555 TaxID=2903662 RepID=UPI00225729C5|nr:glycosyltransferase 87 family protein [Streptomyces sp. NBC_00555]MCX5016025.1 glycosyltransferase 87 family protein [Streptomyces sp. NBC_00555]
MTAMTASTGEAVRRVGRRRIWVGGWLLAAAWAAVFPLVSTLDTHRVWGTCAAAGYTGAALASCLLPRPRARTWAVACALLGALVLPLLYLLLTGNGQSEVAVIERSAELMVSQSTPYLADPQTVTDYNPYLPGMALFGLPRALLGDGGPARVLGDARIWCAAVFLLSLWAGRRVLAAPVEGRAVLPSPRRAPRTTLAVLLASPVVALPLCVSGVDLPMTGLCCLGLALAARRRPVAAGLVLAAACSLKWTAWPALAVAVALLAGSGGARRALRCAVVAAAGTLAVVLPSALLSPGPMFQQVLAFPTGRAPVATPAASPLPGRLLADLGPAGWYAAVALLLCGGIAVAASLVVRPPAGVVAAADRLALGLCVAFLLAPAGRFGYLALPLVLVVWPRITTGSRRTGALSAPRAAMQGAAVPGRLAQAVTAGGAR